MEKADEILNRLHIVEKQLSGPIQQSFLEEINDARKAGALAYMARALVQATLPHREPKGLFFQRQNGAFVLTLMASPDIGGLPYGTIPRLLMSWITTEAVRTRSRDLRLGQSLSDFMEQLGLVPTGGRWGSITRLRKQAFRLFGSVISCLFRNDERRHLRQVVIADEYDEWFWKPPNPWQGRLFSSQVTLSEGFFREIIASPIQLDLRTLRKLSRSPLAIDIYVWLSYRLSYLERKTLIPWEGLELQFGSDFATTTDFKKKFLKRLSQVIVEYPAARVQAKRAGLVLTPSPPHVRLK